MRKLLGLICSLLLLSGCEKEATNVVPPESKSKIVLYSFISPQDAFIKVKLTKSIPFFGTRQNFYGDFENVVDANVTITNGSQTSTIDYDPNSFEYRLSSLLFPILPNQTYTLNVIAADGETISASCKIPNDSIVNVITEVPEITENYTTQSKVISKFQDFSGIENYYRAYAQYIIFDTLNLDTNYLDSYDQNLTGDYEKDGQTIELVNDFLTPINAPQYYYNENSIVKGYDIYLMNIDANYYKYQNSADNFGYDDPFREPTPIYTNVVGGLGVFAGYQKTKIQIN